MFHSPVETVDMHFSVTFQNALSTENLFRRMVQQMNDELEEIWKDLVIA
jgi:hypothetical protein